MDAIFEGSTISSGKAFYPLSPHWYQVEKIIRLATGISFYNGKTIET